MLQARQAGVVSNSRNKNKIHPTWGPSFSRTLLDLELSLGMNYDDDYRSFRELDIEAEMSFISLKSNSNKRGFAEGVGLAPNVGLTARDSFVGLEGRL